MVTARAKDNLNLAMTTCYAAPCRELALGQRDQTPSGYFAGRLVPRPVSHIIAANNASVRKQVWPVAEWKGADHGKEAGSAVSLAASPK